MNNIIEIKNLKKQFNDIVLFQNVNINFKEKGLYGLKGESGSGKSTLLYILGLLDDDYEGKIKILNHNIKDISNKEKFIKKHIGFVFQTPVFIFDMTVIDNLYLIVDKKYQYKVDSLLDRMHLKHLKYKKISSLSGGEKIRLELLRSIINNPEILLCDEPTGSLDPLLGHEIMELLKEESKYRLVIVVSHDDNLLNKYVDSLLILKDKQINFLRNNEVKDIKEIKSNNLTNTLSFKHILKYILVAYQRKKIQTIICLFSLILSFFTIGFSFLLKDEISSSIKESFASFMDNDQVLIKGKAIEEKNEDISIQYEEGLDLINSSSYFYDLNYLYYADFENQFKDANYLALLGENSLIFPEVNLRSVSEAINVNDIPLNKKLYPYELHDLDYNEGILGLRKRDIRKICAALNLDNQNEESLSEYLKYKRVEFCFFFQNESWNYYNEVLFVMRGFFLSEDKIIIAHTENDFVSNFIEEKMKLPCTNDLKCIDYYPWTIKKALYIRCKKEDEYEAIKEYLSSSYYKNYDFRKVKGNLNSSFLSSSYHEGKYIVTYSSDNKIAYNDISYLKDDINNIYPVGTFYPLVESMMVSGFPSSFFFAPNKELLEEVEDYYSRIKENIDVIDISKMKFSKQITYGNLITSAMNKGVKLYLKKPSIKEGRYPLYENEIMISSTLKEKLFSNNDAINKHLYLMKNDYNEVFYNNFKKDTLIICGVFENENEFIYHEAYWFIIYLVLHLNYNLEDVQISSFVGQSNVDVEILNRKYRNLQFDNPLKSVYESVDSMMDMIEIILNMFVVLLFVISLSILYVTMQNIMKKASKEIAMFKSLGTSKYSIFLLYILYGISYSLIALILSCFMLFVTSSVIRIFYFKKAFSLVVSKSPYVIMIITSFLLALPLSLIQIIIPLKKDALSLLKRYY